MDRGLRKAEILELSNRDVKIQGKILLFQKTANFFISFS